jgi:holo-[acyl-carrier protein] synthase
MDSTEGVLGRARVVLEIAEVERLLARGPAPFTDAERAYARSKSDPERRLAARLAAKRAVREILGPDIALEDVEVVAGRGGPPTLRLSAAAESLARQRGGGRLLLSLTHERRHAAAVVLLLAAGA